MTQRFSLYDDLDVAENLEFAAEIFGLARKRRRERVGAALERYGLGTYARVRAGALSGGWKQRLALAAATIHEPELLVLDEPTAGVDPQSRRAFWEQLFELAGARHDDLRLDPLHGRGGALPSPLHAARRPPRGRGRRRAGSREPSPAACSR